MKKFIIRLRHLCYQQRRRLRLSEEFSVQLSSKRNLKLEWAWKHMGLFVFVTFLTRQIFFLLNVFLKVSSNQIDDQTSI